MEKKEIKVATKHYEQIKEVQNTVNTAVTTLGNADFQVVLAQVNHENARQDLAKALEKRKTIIETVAGALDIDLEKESWTFDFDKGCFINMPTGPTEAVEKTAE